MSKPILFAMIGAVTGLLVSQIGMYAESEVVALYLFGAILLVANTLLVWQKQSKRFMFLNAALVALILGSLISWHVWQGYHDESGLVSLFIFAIIQMGVIATTFAQAWKADKPHYRYADLFENGWNNHFFFLFSGLLTGGFLLILLLGTQLFKSIGLDINDIIWNEYVTPIVVGTLVGAGIGISREHESLIFKIRSVFFALFRIMAYLAAAIVVLFAFSLPFSWQGLFNNDSTSVILLSLVGVSILLLNTWIDNDDSTEPQPSTVTTWKDRIFMLQIALLPFLALLSVYAISLRISQYGLMPNRIIALSIAVMLVLYSVSYAYQTFKQRGDWRTGMMTVNPLLALIWLGVLITLASPVLDPVRLTVNNQLDRLQHNKTTVEDFDFYALKHRLGKTGEAAIETIRGWKDHPQYAQIEKQLDRPSYNNKKMAVLTFLGEKPEHAQALIKHYSPYSCSQKKQCFVTLLDMNRDNKKEAVVVKFGSPSSRYISAEILQYGKDEHGYDKHKRWQHIARLSVDLKSNQSQEQVIEMLKAGKLTLIRPVYDDLKLGDIEFRSQ